MSTIAPTRRGKAWLNALIGIAIVVVLVILIVPAVQKTREAAARTQSINNLKNIALGAHGFHDSYRRLPFNGSDKQPPKSNFKYSTVFLDNNFTTGSWMAQMTPYIESLMDLTPMVRELPWPIYRCPGRGRPRLEKGQGAWADYFINNYINDAENAETPDNPDMRRNLDDITDGAANTIFAGHGSISTEDYRKTSGVVGSSSIFVGGTFGTARAGRNWRPGQKPSVSLQQDSADEPDFLAGGWGGPFPQGGLMAMCDAHVRLFVYDMSGETFGAFLTPTGAEKVELLD